MNGIIRVSLISIETIVTPIIQQCDMSLMGTANRVVKAYQNNIFRINNSFRRLDNENTILTDYLKEQRTSKVLSGHSDTPHHKTKQKGQQMKQFNNTFSVKLSTHFRQLAQFIGSCNTDSSFNDRLHSIILTIYESLMLVNEVLSH